MEGEWESSQQSRAVSSNREATHQESNPEGSLVLGSSTGLPRELQERKAKGRTTLTVPFYPGS